MREVKISLVRRISYRVVRRCPRHRAPLPPRRTNVSQHGDVLLAGGGGGALHGCRKPPAGLLAAEQQWSDGRYGGERGAAAASEHPDGTGRTGSASAHAGHGGCVARAQPPPRRRGVQQQHGWAARAT